MKLASLKFTGKGGADHLPQRLLYEACLHAEACPFRIPDLLKSAGLLVQVDRKCQRRLDKFEFREGEFEAIHQSVAQAFKRAPLKAYRVPKGEFDWRHTRYAGSVEEAESMILSESESRIVEAINNRDADFLILFGKALEAEREKRHNHRVLPRSRLWLFLLSNWNEAFDVPTVGSGTVFFPPFCTLSDTALSMIARALGMPIYDNKVVTRDLQLKRTHSALVRGISHRGKILRLTY